MRLDLQQHPFLTRLPVWILFLACVLLCHLIDVIFSNFSCYLVDDTTSDHYEFVGIPLFRNSKGYLWIFLDVLMLDATYRGVDENIVAVSIYPCRSDLGGAIGIHGC